MLPILSSRDLIIWQQAAEPTPAAGSDQLQKQCEPVGKLLRALIRSLQDKVDG